MADAQAKRKRTVEKEDEEFEWRVKKAEVDFKRWVIIKEMEQDEDLNRRVKEKEKMEYEDVRRMKQEIKSEIEKKEAEEAKCMGDETYRDFWRRVNQKVKRMIEKEKKEEEATGIKKEEGYEQFHKNIGKIVEDEKDRDAEKLSILKKDYDKIIHESALRQSQQNKSKRMIKQHEDEKAKGTVETEENEKNKPMIGHRIDDCSAADFFTQLLPVVEEEPREITNEELTSYYTKVSKSQGFDVPSVGGTLFGRIRPMLHMDKEDEILLKDFSKQALETYNNKNKRSGSSRFIFDGLVKVNVQGVAGLVYYITFKAVTFDHTSRTFCAKVWDKVSGPPEIEFCEMADSKQLVKLKVEK